ncbi:ABC transporter permease [Neobacillus massiliamazoniensis]|jgi:ABC-2 type transport system permease protein|uniref:Daunorubicin resistance ABC transporter permease n=1 Tax=Neobacillus massiliamazoniensis TaxID=1499688 RepID=A0A0U1P4H5_9BACI|nr:ABC transporter permease [Neobacillus massiliamazoniensis]CRK85150.1 daunorubicin resistance ABC transporter permease [Neobacillus massiliamazoniensis]
MRVYLSVLKLRLLYGMQYRVAALAGVVTQFFWGFIMIMVFEAFYEHTSKIPPISLTQLINYIWLQQAFLAFIMLWFRDNELMEMITSGNIAYELCRPCELYGFWYAKLLAQRLSSALLRCFPILLVSFFLPKPYNLTLPPSLSAFLLFLSALLLGLFLLVAISMFIYISVFVTLSPMGSLLVFGVLGEFFAGLVIPIPLMPAWLQQIANILPFRWTADFPFRVYSGQIPQHDAIIGILIQLVYLLFLVWLGRIALNSVLKKVVVQGG